MDNGKAYSTLRRLLQIEGPRFADNVTATFAEAGVPKEEVEKALAWAIGEDFNKVKLRYWPHRLRENLKLDVKESDKVKDGVLKLAQAWKEKKNEAANRSTELRRDEDRNDDESDPQFILPR